MSQRYSKPQTDEEKEQLMATRKGKVSEVKGERASVSRERRIALALRAVLDVTDNMVLTSSTDEPLSYACIDATKTLNELGYGDLVGLPKQLAALESQLRTATEARDYTRVAELGASLARVKAGKAARTAEAPSE